MKKYGYYIAIGLLSLLSQMVQAAMLQPFVDVLAWRASQSNSAWVTTISLLPGGTNVENRLMTYYTRPGVKAGLSFLCDDNFWDTKLYWTAFTTENTSNVPVGAGIVSSLFFSGSFFISGDLFAAARSHWKLVMNMLDLEISRQFKLANPLTLSPRVGLKGGSINQEINVNWNAILYHSHENVISDFTGIGPKVGLDAKWNFCQKFNLVSDVDMTLMYGRWNMKDTYARPVSLVTTQTTIMTSLNRAQLGSLMMDFYVGLEWEHHGNSNVAVRLGYEMQYWSNQLRLIAVQQLPAQGDLTLQGATCGIAINL